MSRKAVTAGVLSLALWSGFPPVMAADPLHDQADWWVGKGERNGHEIIVRALGHLPDAKTRADFQSVATISWSYARSSDGMPSREEAEQAFDFENAIETRIEHSGLAMQAMSVTGNGKHDWSYYVSDRGKFFAAFTAIKADFPDCPVSMEIHADETWQALHDVLTSAGK